MGIARRHSINDPHARSAIAPRRHTINTAIVISHPGIATIFGVHLGESGAMAPGFIQYSVEHITIDHLAMLRERLFAYGSQLRERNLRAPDDIETSSEVASQSPCCWTISTDLKT
jgi:hypothetical protein